MKLAAYDLVLVFFVKLIGFDMFYQLKFDILLKPVAAGKPLDRIYPITGLLAMNGERKSDHSHTFQ